MEPWRAAIAARISVADTSCKRPEITGLVVLHDASTSAMAGPRKKSLCAYMRSNENKISYGY